MRFRAFISCLLAVLCQLALVLPRTAFALEPPRPGEIEFLKQTGEYADRLARAKALGNDRIDPVLLERALYGARREAILQQGGNPDEVLPAPPGSSAGRLPSKGTVKVFALLIDFLDYPAYSTQSAVHSALFGDGSGIPSNVFPYESFNNYYERSSYAQLHFSSGSAIGWYHAPYNRSAVPQTYIGRENLIKEAIAAFDGSVDFSQFNNDTSDNQIEYFIVIWTGPDNGWANFWWGYDTGWSDPSYTVDGVTLGNYSWQWEHYGGTGPLDPGVVIHETGHGLGLPDLYDYDGSVGPDGGVGGLDQMDGSGDHNCFSKWVLEWLTPAVVAAGSQTLTLSPSGNSQDAVLIMPGATSTDAFREFFMAQNRYRVGNDPSWYPTDGMVIWHVDARLNNAGTWYAYDNSYTEHKLVKLMQADGLDRIENYGVGADAAMYYNPGKSLGPLTAPSSWTYQGVDTGANVTGISQSWPQMTATFSIDDPRLLPTLTVTKAGNGSGAVTSTDGGISLGSDGQQSYVSGTVVTLQAVPAPGSSFAGWSGGGSGGGTTRTVTMSADTAVTATFTTTLLLDEDFDPESPDPPAGWYFVNPLGASWWWFDYPEYNTSGGGGACALGAQYAISDAYDSELQTPAMDLSAYAAASLGLEFKTSIEACSETADVDVSVNGSSGPWTNVWTSTTNLCGPQTVNIDLTSTAAGYSNVVLRFRHYGTSLWWVIDDVKIMAAAPAGVPAPNVVLELHPNERAPGASTNQYLGKQPWTQPTSSPAGSYWWKKYEFAAHGPLWVQICAQNWDKVQKGYGDHDDTQLQFPLLGPLVPVDYDGIQSGAPGTWQWAGGAESGKRTTLRFLVPCLPGKQALWIGADESPVLWWLKVIDLEPGVVEPF